MIWAVIVWAAAAAFLSYVAGSATGRRQIAAAAALIAGWAFKGLIELSPTIALGFVKVLVSTFEENKDLWASVVAVFVREMTGKQIDEGALAAALGAGPLDSSAQAAGAPIIAALLDLVAPDQVLTPESGQEGLKRLLGLTTALGLQGWYVQTAGELVALGHFAAAADLPERMEGGFGLRNLGRLVWRIPIQKAINEPMTVALNRRYQFTRLTLAEGTKAYHRGLLDAAAFADVAADAGFSPDRAQILLALAAQPLSQAEITQLYRQRKVTRDDAVGLLRSAGYLEADAGHLVDHADGLEQQKLLSEIATTARRLYKAGDLTEDEYRGFLGEANFTDDEITLALAADQLAMREEKALTLAELHGLLAAKLITPEDYRARLTRMHYASADIDLFLAQGVKKLSPHQIAVALTQGKLTEEQAQADLIALGYSADDAAAFLALHGKHLSEGQVLEALRNGLVTMEQARADLQALGFDATQVDLLLAFQKRVLSPSEIQAAQLRGALTPEDATARLRALGYSAQDASIITDLRVRLLTEGQILQAYGDALIPRATAIADLVERGLSQDEAQSAVTVFDRKQAAAAAKRAAAAAAAFAKAVAAEQKAGGTPPPPATGG